MGKKQKKHSKSKKIAEQGIEKSDFQKYPGFKIAVVFGAIVLVLYLLLIFNSTMNTRSQGADELSAEINYLMNMYLADLDESLDGDYDYALEDDYYASMKDEFEWIQKKELAAYNDFPRVEAEYREFALYLFITHVLNVNEIISFDAGGLDYSAEINSAIANNYETPDIVSDDLNELDLEEADAQKVTTYFNKLLDEYIKEKRNLLNTLQSEERRYVEAKKINYLKYSTSGLND